MRLLDCKEHNFMKIRNLAMRKNYISCNPQFILIFLAQGSEQRRPSNQVMKSSSSENRKPSTEAGSGFGRSGQHGEVRKGNTMRRVKEKQNKTWWLKLPYVLVWLYIRAKKYMIIS